MKLNSIINEDLIFCNLADGTREEIYSSMLEKACHAVDVPLNSGQLLKEIIEREEVLNIPYEGMSLPHLRNSELNDLYIIIGVLEKPVKLKENDLAPTRLVVMSLISGETSDIYLKALAAFTRFFSQPENLARCADVHSASDFFALLDGVKVKEHITADDVMNKEFPTVKENDSLSAALDIMLKCRQSVIPVVDGENHLVGKLDATAVLKSFIPEYLLMMDNLKFVSSFEMFDKIFQEEGVRLVKDFLNPATATILRNTPLVQFTVTLAKHEADMIFIVDDEKKLCGIISMNDIIHKILRG
jgi:CBS domain-containing protein